MEKRTLTMQQMAEFVISTIDAGGTCQLVVTGPSMSPTLQPVRDSVYLTAIRDRSFKKGDIVFYRRDCDHYVLHRIVKRKKDGTYGLNGDGQTQIEWIQKEQILAVVTAFERKGKNVPVQSLRYRLYVQIWMRLRRFRKFFLRWNQWLKISF